jgi:hypothetical protein
MSGVASAGPQNRSGVASAGPQNRSGVASAGPQSKARPILGVGNYSVMPDAVCRTLERLRGGGTEE